MKTNLFDIFTGKAIETLTDNGGSFPGKMYRIYTEDKGPDQTRRLMRQLGETYFSSGLTYAPAHGQWQGKAEKALVISVAEKQTHWESRTDHIPLNVIGAANFIIGFLSQEAVGIERPDGRFELVYNNLGTGKPKENAPDET